MAVLPFPKSAPKPTRIFENGVRQSEQARAAEDERNRQAEAARLRRELLDADHTREMYMPVPFYGAQRSDDLMPTPDEVASKWGRGDYRIYDEMKRNVLSYGAAVQGGIDMMSNLKINWLPGMKGDRESEQAALEIASVFENIDERSLAIEWWCEGFEKGFSPVENVWGRHTRGAAKDLISIVAWMTRPISWYGFDWLQRPRFKPQHDPGTQTEAVPEYKVTFLRSGSNHTPYGRGFGQLAYPTVWAIDAALKGYMALTERFGYFPMVATYPNEWASDGSKVANLKAHLAAQSKNVIVLPGEVDQVRFTFPSTDAAYASANASGQSRMLYVKHMETSLYMFVQGSQYTAGNQAEGSLAREQVADSVRWTKAPSRASCLEATLNRGFVRPTMLVNRPNLDESKWPRCSIDAAATEDLAFQLRLYESLAKMKFPISHVTVSEMFSVPVAQPGDAVLDAPDTQPATMTDALIAADRNMEEKNVVTIANREGKMVSMFSDVPIYTENRGIVRAGNLQTGDIPVVDPAAVRAS